MSADRWHQLLAAPAEGEGHAAWFRRIAARLLGGARLHAGREPLRFTEVEFYYHGPGHEDVFTHRDPVQKATGPWYFHRTAGVYRGGSFKGFDLTFGGPDAFGGVLIRGLAREDGSLIDGPSLSVDHLLACTGAEGVARLDGALAGRPAWDPAVPLRLEWVDEGTAPAALETARVGLSLKRLRKADPPTRFILRRYRFLSEPRRISKGKLQMVLALHADGATPEEIRERTGCTKGAIARYIADFAEGARQGADGEAFDGYFGVELGPKELARLHGLWRTRFGSS